MSSLVFGFPFICFLDVLVWRRSLVLILVLVLVLVLVVFPFLFLFCFRSVVTLSPHPRASWQVRLSTCVFLVLCLGAVLPLLGSVQTLELYW